MTGEPVYEIALTLSTADPAAATRAAETLGRTAAGYALDGIDAQLEIIRLDVDQTADEHP